MRMIFSKILHNQQGLRLTFALFLVMIKTNLTEFDSFTFPYLEGLKVLID